MTSTPRIQDRQLGRNAQLLAEATGALETSAERFPYLRILVSLIETAHPEWSQAPQKARQIADLAVSLSGQALDAAEVARVVEVRNEESGAGQA